MAVDTHGTRTGERLGEPPEGQRESGGGTRINRRAALWTMGGLVTAVGLVVTGIEIGKGNGGGQPDSRPSGGASPGTGGSGGEGGEDTSGQFDLSIMGDAIERSPDSQKALAKLLGVSAASLQIQVPPQESWRPGVPEATFAQVTSSGNQGSVHLTLPQRGTLTFAQMKQTLGNGSPGNTTKWFTYNEDVIGEITAPNRGTPGMLGWRWPNTPQESVFGMDVDSPTLAGMTPDQKIEQIRSAAVVLIANGVFDRPA